jgi:hypothetical protein
LRKLGNGLTSQVGNKGSYGWYERRLIRSAAMWHWREKWSVGFEQHICWWTPQRSFPHIVCGFKRDDSRKR